MDLEYSYIIVVFKWRCIVIRGFVVFYLLGEVVGFSVLSGCSWVVGW